MLTNKIPTTVVHIDLTDSYSDYFGYHDNLLPKYHKKFIRNVFLIVTNRDYNGKIYLKNELKYSLNDGQQIIRVMPKNNYKFNIGYILAVCVAAVGAGCRQRTFVAVSYFGSLAHF